VTTFSSSAPLPDGDAHAPESAGVRSSIRLTRILSAVAAALAFAVSVVIDHLAFGSLPGGRASIAVAGGAALAAVLLLLVLGPVLMVLLGPVEGMLRRHPTLWWRLAVAGWVVIAIGGLWCLAVFAILPGQSLNAQHMTAYRAGMIPAAVFAYLASRWVGRRPIPLSGPLLVALGYAAFFHGLAAWLPAIYASGTSFHLVHGCAAAGVLLAMTAAGRAAVITAGPLRRRTALKMTVAGVAVLSLAAATFVLSYRSSYAVRDAAARGGRLSRTLLRYSQFLLFPRGHGLQQLAARVLAASAGDLAKPASTDENLWPALLATKPTSFLVITVDALRADTGLERPGIAFTSHRAVAPGTRESLTTMFTGLRAWQQGPDLFALLRRRGFYTLAVGNAPASNPYLLVKAADSFEVQTYRPTDMEHPFAAELTDAALEKLSAARGRPFFTWIHYLDPHEPYDAPGKSRQQRYLGEVTQTMREVDRLLQGLRQRGQLEHTLVVLTADHGEAFGEHGNDYHNMTLYDEVLHVPLILMAPKGAVRGTVGHVTSAIDLVSALAPMAGLTPVPESHPWFRPSPAASAFAFTAIAPSRWRPVGIAAVVRGRYKLMYELRLRSAELYDLESDPRETRNLVEERPAIAAALATDLLAEFGRTGVSVD
jgi:hypothetical protein